jgi:hypothetical protein
VRFIVSLLFIIIICVQFSGSFFLTIIKQANYYYRQYNLNYANNFTELNIPIETWGKSDHKEIVVNGCYYDIKTFKINKNGFVTVIAKPDEFDSFISFVKKEIGSEKNNNSSKSNDGQIKIFGPVWFDRIKNAGLLPPSSLKYSYLTFVFNISDCYCKEIFNPPKIILDQII